MFTKTALTLTNQISIQANENFHSVKDVAAYGAGNSTTGISSCVPNLDTDSDTDALAASQGVVIRLALSGKQDTIVWTPTPGKEQTIKTINGQSLEGPGNLIIEGGGSGGTEYYAGSGISINTAFTISISEDTWGVINNKYDKTGGTVSGSVIALQEVSAYGSGNSTTGISSVVDNLYTESSTDALSANQGMILNNTKQETLVSGVNIKTINNESILGEGNITIQGGGTGGTEYSAGTGITITSDTISISDSTWQLIGSKYDKTGGTVSGSVVALQEVAAYGAGNSTTGISSIVDDLSSTSQTDALSANQGRVLKEMVIQKQNTLVSGVNIKTINNESILGSGNIVVQGGGGSEYTAGANISIQSDVISVTGITGNSHPSMTAGTATHAISADTATSATSATSATTATKWGGYNIVVGQSGSDNMTIYFLP